ncbi:MAG: amidase domain-containing protein [Clostridia bacterium]|nr:amidase domain-containing protein [Clostridia bacterium]
MPYDREKALAYAQMWALSRNPAYGNFDHMGGDCTNFVSQCLFAGAGVMDFSSPVYGWYYLSLSDRAPAWTGVNYLWNYLLRKNRPGPIGHPTTIQRALPGDAVLLSDETDTLYHAMLLVTPYPDIHVAAHTRDVWMKSLSDYTFHRAHFFHVDGVME